MSHYIAFIRKELLESIRTYKLLIMLLVFFAFGVMNPLIAKLTPDLLNALMSEGISITLAEPSAFDSWTQFFKNITQMGVIVMVIVFSGLLGTELSKGTLINMLTKGLSRAAVILSKYTCMVLIWTASVVISFLVTWGYTVYLFPGDKVVNLLFSVFCIWLFGVFLSALLLFAATLTKSNYGCLLITGAGVVICTLCNIIPDAYKYNPLSLAANNMNLITNTMAVSSLYDCIWITGILSFAMIAASVLIFRKKQL